MSLKKFNLLVLFINICIYMPSNCMEENAMAQEPIENEIEFSWLEQLPDEILLLAFTQGVNSIINTNHPADAEKEFKKFFYSICLVDKRFYMFHEDVKKHFDKNKKHSIQEIRNMIFGKLNYTWETA